MRREKFKTIIRFLFAEKDPKNFIYRRSPWIRQFASSILTSYLILSISILIPNSVIPFIRVFEVLRSSPGVIFMLVILLFFLFESAFTGISFLRCLLCKIAHGLLLLSL